MAGYEAEIARMASELSKENLSHIVEFLSYPDRIRGFGHIREKSLDIAAESKMKIEINLKNSAKKERKNRRRVKLKLYLSKFIFSFIINMEACHFFRHFQS